MAQTQIMSCLLYFEQRKSRYLIYNSNASKSVSVFRQNKRSRAHSWTHRVALMFGSHTEAEMPVSPLTVASVDQKLLLFALCYYYRSLSTYMKHKLQD